MVGIKKIYAIILLTTVAFSFSGCSLFTGKSNITDLLSAPVISQEEGEIIDAIKNYLGENIVLKYSQSLGYSSPIQLIDINNDGEEEAITFYYAPNKGANIRLAILSYIENKWSVIIDKEGLGTDVFFFDTTTFEGISGKQILVGYVTPKINENFFVTYFTDKDANISDYIESCQEIVCADVTDDNHKEVILVKQLDGTRKKIEILEFSHQNGFEVISSDKISNSNVIITQILVGKNSKGKTAIYIDYKDNYGKAYTKIRTFADGKLTASSNKMIVEKLWEYDWFLLSRDIDNDGVIEVPTVIQESRVEVLPVIKRIEWTDYSEDAVTRKYYGVCDTQSGMFMAMPDEWQDYIYVAYDDGNWGVYSSITTEKLVGVESVVEYDDIDKNSHIKRIGTKLWKINFSDKVDQQQKNYILNSVVALK